MRNKIIAAAMALALLAGSAIAGEMTFNKTIDMMQLASELHAATGYWFVKQCPEDSCKVQGHMRATPTSVTITIYEADMGAAWISTATFNAALQSDITSVVNSHTP